MSVDDRAAVFTRFYRRNSYRDVAAVLRTTEDSARKRVSRALERRRAFFTKNGVLLSAAGLAGLAAGSALASTSTLMLVKGAVQAMFIAKAKIVRLPA